MFATKLVRLGPNLSLIFYWTSDLWKRKSWIKSEVRLFLCIEIFEYWNWTDSDGFIVNYGNSKCYRRIMAHQRIKAAYIGVKYGIWTYYFWLVGQAWPKSLFSDFSNPYRRIPYSLYFVAWEDFANHKYKLLGDYWVWFYQK